MSTETQSIQKHDARSLKGLLQMPAYQKRFEEILGRRAPQFMASLIQVGTSSSYLERCDPNTIIAAAITAAALDLPIDKNLGFAHIIPYGNQAQFQLGYKAFIQLAIRTGQYQFLNCCVVHNGELVKYNELTAEIVLDPAKRESEEVIGYAAYFKLMNGFEHAEYWSKAEVESHAKTYSQAYKSNRETPWKSNFDSMALKTVIKSILSHWGIMSIEMQRAITHDQGIQRNIDAEVTYPDNNSAEAVVALAEVKTPEASAAAAVTTPEPVQEKVVDPLIDRAKPHDSLFAIIKRDQVAESSVLDWAKKKKLAGAACPDVAGMSEANCLKLLDAWPNVVEEIKKL